MIYIYIFSLRNVMKVIAHTLPKGHKRRNKIHTEKLTVHCIHKGQLRKLEDDCM